MDEYGLHGGMDSRFLPAVSEPGISSSSGCTFPDWEDELIELPYPVHGWLNHILWIWIKFYNLSLLDRLLKWHTFYFHRRIRYQTLYFLQTIWRYSTTILISYFEPIICRRVM